MPLIYLVEDDASIQEVVLYALRQAGFEAEGFGRASLLYDNIAKRPPDLILLDILLPEENGLSILRRLRALESTRDTPIIMLTAKGTEMDKVTGLDLGADDYMAKPFSILELLARVKAHLRRTKGADEKPQVLAHGGIVLDKMRRRVTVLESEITLTYKEFELLAYLMENAELVLSREQIIRAVWGYDFEGETRTIDMHIKSLRKKLEDCGECIKTIRNVGYKLESRV